MRAYGFVLLAAMLPLMGARCGQVDPQYRTGPSKDVPYVAGSGVNWAYGQFPFTPLSFAGDLMSQINTERRQNGLQSLRWHDGMALVAQKHSLDMHSRSYLSLVSPEGIDLGERLVSSIPRIDFDESYHFVAYTQTPSQVYAQLESNADANLVIHNPDVTHFGASFQSNPGPYHVTILFGVNVRP
jgi:hypothetical protein